MTKTAETRSDTPPTRLVIRIKLPPRAQGPAAPPVQRRWTAVALTVIAAALAVVLGWWGIRMFRAEPPPAPVAAATRPSPLPQPPPPVVAPEPEVGKPAVKPTLPVNEVTPEVAPSARETVRGTIRVSIRVMIDKEGKVVAATAEESGPSRYFLRLALDAARKWTFTPSAAEEQRAMMLRFYFKRSGTTAHAESL